MSMVYIQRQISSGKMFQFSFFTNLIYKMFFKKKIDNAISVIVSAVRKEEQERKQRFAERTIGKPVIIIPSNNEDPVIGVIRRYEKFSLGDNSRFPIVYDFITKQELSCVSDVLPFTGMRFIALMKLNPLQRCHVVTGEDYRSPYQKPEDIALFTKKMTFSEITERLIENGFFSTENIPEQEFNFVKNHESEYFS